MKLVAAVAVLLLSTVGIDRLPAQELGPWGPVPARAFSLELARPGLEDVNLSFASFLFYPRVRAPVSVSVAVVGELPFARLGVDDIDVSGTILGNPYVGVEFVGVDGFEAGVGLRIPLGSEGGDLGSVGAIFAALADFDRFEAWIEKTAAFKGRVGYCSRSPTGFQGCGGVGMMAYKPRFNDANSETEVFADYRFNAAYREARLAVGAEFTGRYFVSASGAEVGQRTFHQLAFGMGAGLGRVWPTLAIRIPLDDNLKAAFSTVLELGVVVPF